MESSNGTINDCHHQSSSVASSIRCVAYRCGSCGYDLNLSSSTRNTTTIGSKYGKSMKKGIISFFCIDESRFTQVEEFQCVPYFISKSSLGLFRRRTKLLCRKCNNYVGNAFDDKTSSYPLVTDGSDSASGSDITTYRKYDVKINALQPTSSVESGSPLVVISTVYYMAPFATMILAVPALILEGAGVVECLRTCPTLVPSLVIIFGLGVTAFCLNFSIFYVIHSTTAVTFNVAGNLKVTYAVLFSWMIFKNPNSVMNAVGCAVTLVGCTFCVPEAQACSTASLYILCTWSWPHL